MWVRGTMNVHIKLRKDEESASTYRLLFHDVWFVCMEWPKKQKRSFWLFWVSSFLATFRWNKKQSSMHISYLFLALLHPQSLTVMEIRCIALCVISSICSTWDMHELDCFSRWYIINFFLQRTFCWLKSLQILQNEVWVNWSYDILGHWWIWYCLMDRKI